MTALNKTLDEILEMGDRDATSPLYVEDEPSPIACIPDTTDDLEPATHDGEACSNLDETPTNRQKPEPNTRTINIRGQHDSSQGPDSSTALNVFSSKTSLLDNHLDAHAAQAPVTASQPSFFELESESDEEILLGTGTEASQPCLPTQPAPEPDEDTMPDLFLFETEMDTDHFNTPPPIVPSSYNDHEGSSRQSTQHVDKDTLIELSEQPVTSGAATEAIVTPSLPDEEQNEAQLGAETAASENQVNAAQEGVNTDHVENDEQYYSLAGQNHGSHTTICGKTYAHMVKDYTIGEAASKATVGPTETHGKGEKTSHAYQSCPTCSMESTRTLVDVQTHAVHANDVVSPMQCLLLPDSLPFLAFKLF